MATGRLVRMVPGGAGLPGGAEVLAGAVRPVLVVDASDTWSHGVDRYAGDEEEGRLLSVDVVETGPVRATVRSVWSFGGGRTTVAQEVSLYEGETSVEVRLDVDWHETHRVLKLVVPVALETRRAWPAPPTDRRAPVLGPRGADGPLGGPLRRLGGVGPRLRRRRGRRATTRLGSTLR